MGTSKVILKFKEDLKYYIKCFANRRGFYITRIFPEHLDSTPLTLQRMKNQGFKPSSILDVGASDGSWTRSAMRIFPLARYLLIEPREDKRAQLTTFQEMNKNVIVSYRLVGETKGQNVLYEQGDQSTLFSTRSGINANPKLKEMTTIDSIITELDFPCPQFIKLDIQGAELLALQGGKNALRGAKYVTMEITFLTDRVGWPLAEEAIHFMSINGYVIYDIYEIARNEQNMMFQCMMTFKNTK